MDMKTWTTQLKDYALSRGIDLLGITSAKPFVKKGETETVIDPREILPEAQSIVVTGFYMKEAIADQPQDKENPKGRFTHGYSLRAFTAMENYYIGIIREFLEGQGYRVVANPNYRIPDKMAAVRSGIGKYGKNSLIVTEDYGSCMMFVTLVTDAPLEYEELDVHLSDCSNCERCMKACPTGAIQQPYRVKRELCITSWLWGGFIPVHLREKQENRLFGCGECVKACPRNHKLVPRKAYPVEVESIDTSPELIPLLTGDRDYFLKIFGSFPNRAGVEALLGNAIIAMGNRGTEKTAEPLCHTLTHGNPQIRAYSAWALGRIAGVQGKVALEKALETEEEPRVREEIQQALTT